MSGIGSAIKESRKEKNITQESIGDMGFCSGKLISAIERGERQISVDVLEKVTMGLDDPRVYLEATNEVTGGVFGVHWLDGENADLHKSSVKEKVIEELEEAIQAISLVKTANNSKLCSVEQRKIIRKSIMEVIDVYVASAHYIAIMCKEYCFSIKDLFKEHREKLISKGFLKRKI